MRKISVAVFGLLTMACGALADDGPSYEETVGFLKSKMNTTYKSGSDYKKTVEFIELKKCNFNYEEKSYENGNLNYESYQPIEIGKLDPSKVRILNNLVTADTYEGKKYFRFIYKKYYSINNGPANKKILNSCKKISGKLVCSEEKLSDGIAFNQFAEPYSENQIRVQKALIHLIKLCGGKEELF